VLEFDQPAETSSGRLVVCRDNGGKPEHSSIVLDPTPPSTTTEDSAAAPPGRSAGAVDVAPGGEAEVAETGFLAETLAELRKVVWPSRQQLFSESVAVVLMVGLSAAAIAAVDRFFGWVAGQVFR
jgi:preprotein translocase subunit SecE